MATTDQARSTTPLCTVGQAARYLQMPASTLSTWVDGYERAPRGRRVHGDPLVTASAPEQRGWPRPPFVGFAEAYVLDAEVVQDYLRTITFPDGFAGSIHPHRYAGLAVVMDPRRSRGRPIFSQVGVSVDDVMARIRAGEDLEMTARDYGLPVPEVRAPLALVA